MGGFGLAYRKDISDMQVDAFLCDAATVREGLLHILGGGITRLGRAGFPAQFGCDLAVSIQLHPIEAQDEQSLRTVVVDGDGTELARLEGTFRAAPSPGLEPGELVAVPFVVGLSGLQLPAPGIYSVELLLNGTHVRSLRVDAHDTSPQQPEPE